MTDETLEQFITRERERLAKQRDDVLARQQKIEEELAAIDHELDAISAYEAAKRSNPAELKRTTRTSGARVTRVARQQGVFELIHKHPDGLSRSDILQALGLKGDKSGEQSVSNALSALKKAGRLVGEDGKYRTA